MTHEELISYCEMTARQNEILMKRYDDASGYSRSHNEKIRTEGAKGCEKLVETFREIAERLKFLQAYDEGHLGCQFCEYENRDQLERPCSSCCRSYKDNFKAKKEGE